MIEVGLKHTSELTVSEGLTAIQMGSGDIRVSGVCLFWRNAAW